VRRRAALALLAGLASLVVGCGPSGGSGTAGAPKAPASTDSGPRLARLYAGHARDVWVECSGTVERVLEDDRDPPRHERFVLRVPGDDAGTILVAHNIDLAPRVPLHAGDTVTLRGEYEWNPQGGVIHETHHATSARGAPGGWVRFAGTTYQ
jgi:hypothetical protein